MKKAWNKWHRWECKNLHALRTKPGQHQGYYEILDMEQTRLLAQVLIMHEHNKLAGEEWANFLTLANRWQHATPEEEVLGRAAVVCALLIAGQDPPSPPSIRLATQLMGIIKTNTLTLQNLLAQSRERPLGSGLCPLLARLNHACLPNCFLVQDGPALTLRARRPIAQGEELTISYVGDTALAFQDTQDRLWGSYRFQCACHYCTHGEKGYLRGLHKKVGKRLTRIRKQFLRDVNGGSTILQTMDEESKQKGPLDRYFIMLDIMCQESLPSKPLQAIEMAFHMYLLTINVFHPFEPQEQVLSLIKLALTLDQVREIFSQGRPAKLPFDIRLATEGAVDYIGELIDNLYGMGSKTARGLKQVWTGGLPRLPVIPVVLKNARDEFKKAQANITKDWGNDVFEKDMAWPDCCVKEWTESRPQ